MKRGLNLQLALISLASIADDAKNKTLSEIILFIVNASKRIMVLDETPANQQEKDHLQNLESELKEKVSQSTKNQQAQKKQLANLSQQTQANQRALENIMAQKHLELLENNLIKEYRQAKERRVALILNGLAFSLLAYLNKIEHPMIKDVIEHLAFKKVSSKPLEQAYNALIQLRNELQAGLHQLFLVEMTNRWENAPHQSEAITQLMHIFNTLTPHPELTPEELPSADADFTKKNQLGQSNILLKLNSSFVDLTKETRSVANSTLIYYGENTAYPLNSSASINPHIDFFNNTTDTKENKRVNNVSPLETTDNIPPMAVHNTDVYTPETENNSSDLNSNKIQPINGSMFIYYNDNVDISVSHSLLKPNSIFLQNQESNNIAIPLAKISPVSQTIFSQKYQRTIAHVGNALTNDEPEWTKLLNFDSDSDSESESDLESDTSKNTAITSQASETSETDLEKNKFKRFKELHDADYMQKTTLTWLASKTTSFILGQSSDMHNELTSNRIKSWQQVVEYVTTYPERKSAELYKTVEAEFSNIDNTIKNQLNYKYGSQRN